ncbi:hypothetical protein TNCV_381301 [Trichonephila clavipes]|uniref:Uncharacterized protein n=1 Tax=Trichonephila clavipes TaxID=2585209 RepID=A0A8X6VKQ3_TRICX|nr:hypothetical protein TNCV_381301 [Trichonephila clavipes]
MGWIEMGCHGLIMLGVTSGSTTVGSISIHRFCTQKTCSRPTTNYNTFRRSFCRKKYRSSLQTIFTMQVSMQDDQLWVSPSTDGREDPLIVGKRTLFQDQTAMGFCTLKQTSPDSH